MGLIGIISGPVIMILLVTSIEVNTKYMLRTNLEVLAERGDLDLEELGSAEPMLDQVRSSPRDIMPRIIVGQRDLWGRFPGYQAGHDKRGRVGDAFRAVGTVHPAHHGRRVTGGRELLGHRLGDAGRDQRCQAVRAGTGPGVAGDHSGMNSAGPNAGATAATGRRMMQRPFIRYCLLSEANRETPVSGREWQVSVR